MNNLFSAFLGALFSIPFTFWLERQRKPVLEFRIEDPLDIPQAGPDLAPRRNLRIHVTNKRLNPFLRKFLSRDAALNCEARLQFYHLDGQRFFNREMPGRWAQSLEPILPFVFIDGRQHPIIDQGRFPRNSRIEIFPGDTVQLDVAVRFNGEVDAYGWNNDSYFSNPRWRNPVWRIPTNQRYLIGVQVVASNVESRAQFCLTNEGDVSNFHLEVPTLTQRRLIPRSS